jgi:hypothetical protein
VLQRIRLLRRRAMLRDWTLAKVNQICAKSWAERSALLLERIGDPGLRRRASLVHGLFAHLNLRHHLSLEKELEIAAELTKDALGEQAGRGGRARKTDALQRWIFGIEPSRVSTSSACPDCRV